MLRGAKQATGVVLAGRYELLREIASGGMAEVWLGRAKSIGAFERRVAIKCCHPHLRKDPDFVAMFLDEARLAAQIHHPNVVPTLDVVDDPTALFLVMDYVEGATLGTLLREVCDRDARVPVDVALRIVTDALDGLHAAHTLADAGGRPLKIVHRDISPQNILVGVDGVARITDFGIAKAEARATSTREGQVKGKLGYMAPEQLASRGVDARADVFSIGVVLWETLVGDRLFRGDTDVETASLVLHGPVTPPSERIPELPKVLDAIVMRALDRDMSRRFANAAELADAIETCGVPLASARRVGAFVRACAPPVATSTGAQPTPSATKPMPPPVVTNEGATVATNPTVAEVVPPREEPEPPPRKGRAVALVAAFATVVVVGAAAIVVATRTSSKPAANPTMSTAPVIDSAPLASTASSMVTAVPTSAIATTTSATVVASSAPSLAPSKTSHGPNVPPIVKPKPKPPSTGGSEYHPSSL